MYFKERETERLLLRKLSYLDAEALFSYRSKDEVMRYQGFHPKTIQEVERFLMELPEMPNLADTCFQLGIVLKKEKRLIGDIGLHFLPDGEQVEIGYTVDPDYQGYGYATEAVLEILKYLFEELNKHRVLASVDPMNEKSIRLLERLGFRKEAHFKKGLCWEGQWVDDVIYAMLKEEWIIKDSTIREESKK